MIRVHEFAGKPKWRRVALVGAWVLLLGGLSSLVFLHGGPVYQGRPAEYWLNYDYRPPNAEREFREAWQSLGADAVPFLIRALGKTDDSRPGLSYREFRSSLPVILQRVLPLARPPAGVVRSPAASALAVIGPAARSAAPSLRLLAETDAETFVRDAAAAALKAVGPEAVAPEGSR